jgi:D-alanyl-D-alanine carboxypeptidase
MTSAALRRDGCLAAAAGALLSLVITTGHAGGAAASVPRSPGLLPDPSRHTAVQAAVTRATTSAGGTTSTTSTTRTTSSTIDASLTTQIRNKLSHATATGYSAAINVDGLGPVVRLHSAHASRPASTEKLFTTIPMLLVMPDRQLTTEIRATAAPQNGVINGNLVVEARRDPSMTRHALRDLAAQVRQAGVHKVTGKLKVDVRDMSMMTRRSGWKQDSVPWDIGPLSPFPVNEDWYRRDSAYLSHPTLSNASLFRSYLIDAGVHVVGGATVVRHSTASTVITQRTSPTMAAMIRHALRQSDNFYAESFLFHEGVGRVQDLIKTAQIPDAYFTDGSGLSYADRESTRGELKLLRYVQTTSAGDALFSSLPVGCQSGTLVTWFCNTIGSGHVWAKTGTLLHDKALAGYTIDARGRRVTFSFLAHGVRNISAAQRAIAAAVLVMRRYDA